MEIYSEKKTANLNLCILQKDIDRLVQCHYVFLQLSQLVQVAAD